VHPADAEQINRLALPLADAPAGCERAGEIGQRLVRVAQVDVCPRAPGARHGLTVVVAERAHDLHGLAAIGHGLFAVAELAMREAPAVEPDGRLIRLVERAPECDGLAELLQRLRQRLGRLEPPQAFALGDGLLGGEATLVARRRRARLADRDLVVAARGGPLQRPDFEPVCSAPFRDV
jgi:hypothetical protein